MKYNAFINYLPHFKGESLHYATEGSIGFDLYASVDHKIEIKSMSRLLIPTGVRIYSPETSWFIYPRSGIAAKFGVTLMNSVAVIDSDYLGEIKVCLFNSGENTFVVEPGMRIAQGVINNVDKFEFKEIDEASFENIHTERGAGGFGSTGV